MVVFFLLVGMEIKREVVAGELSRPSQVALPIAGALGGILLPAAIYAALNWHDHAALTRLGDPVGDRHRLRRRHRRRAGPARVPPSLRLFLLTLAIVDDLAAIAIIAVFYTAHLSALALLLAGLCILVLVALNALGVRRMLPYLLVGILLWLCVLEFGRACDPGRRRAGLLPAAGRCLRPAGACAQAVGPLSSCCRCSPSPIPASISAPSTRRWSVTRL